MTKIDNLRRVRRSIVAACTPPSIGSTRIASVTGGLLPAHGRNTRVGHRRFRRTAGDSEGHSQRPVESSAGQPPASIHVGNQYEPDAAEPGLRILAEMLEEAARQAVKEPPEAD